MRESQEAIAKQRPKENALSNLPIEGESLKAFKFCGAAGRN